MKENELPGLEFLQRLRKFGMKLGLSRMERLLDYLGRPEKDFLAIHVAGTNGKGSTSAMLANILQAAGFKVGLFTSPHLERFTERIRLNGEEVALEALMPGIEKISAGVAVLEKEEEELPTEFEVITALAFWYFSFSRVDWAVIEAGLGGELDATNVIFPRVAVITNVDYDHTDVLGKSLSAIASTKAGVIKPSVPLVTAAGEEVWEVLKARAEREGAPLVRVFPCKQQEEETSLPGVRVVQWERLPLGNAFWGEVINLYGLQQFYPQLKVSLVGEHQGANAALAVAAVEVLREQGVKVDTSAIYKGLEEVFWPGRCELFSRCPKILLDGAHNPAGAKALAATLKERFAGEHLVFLLGILGDKDREGVVKELAPLADLIITTTPPNLRAGDAASLAEECRKHTAAPVFCEPDVLLALQKGIKALDAKAVLCVTGSLFLVGAVRHILSEKMGICSNYF